MSELFSFFKGKYKGKGKATGERFEGNCSWCGKYCHKKLNSRDLDRFMDQKRAANGNGKSWGSWSQGKGMNDWNHGKGNDPYRGNQGWNSYGGYKGNGKGQSKGDMGQDKGMYNLDDSYIDQAPASNSWGNWSGWNELLILDDTDDPCGGYKSPKAC